MQTSPQSQGDHNAWKNPQSAFQDAIASGRLSDKQSDKHYAGHFMYMGENDAGKALFKNIVTREYLA